MSTYLSFITSFPKAITLPLAFLTSKNNSFRVSFLKHASGFSMQGLLRPALDSSF
jgi:hypothetical protein